MQKAEEIPEKDKSGTDIHHDRRETPMLSPSTMMRCCSDAERCMQGGNTLRHLHRCCGTDGNDTKKRIQLVADGSEYAWYQRFRAAGTAAIVQCWQFKDNPRGRGNCFAVAMRGTFGTRVSRFACSNSISELLEISDKCAMKDTGMSRFFLLVVLRQMKPSRWKTDNGNRERKCRRYGMRKNAKRSAGGT